MWKAQVRPDIEENANNSVKVSKTREACNWAVRRTFPRRESCWRGQRIMGTYISKSTEVKLPKATSFKFKRTFGKGEKNQLPSPEQCTAFKRKIARPRLPLGRFEPWNPSNSAASPPPSMLPPPRHLRFRLRRRSIQLSWRRSTGNVWSNVHVSNSAFLIFDKSNKAESWNRTNTTASWFCEINTRKFCSFHQELVLISNTRRFFMSFYLPHVTSKLQTLFWWLNKANPTLIFSNKSI